MLWKNRNGGSVTLNDAVLYETDFLIKDLITELKNLKRDTLVLFHSDNGGTLMEGCNYPYRGQKAQLAEGGTLSPAFFYRTKGTTDIRKSNALIHISDWLPTLMDMVGIPIPPGLDGISQRNILETASSTGRRERMVYGILDKQINRGQSIDLGAPYHARALTGFRSPDWSHNYAVRIGKWKYYSYRLEKPLKACHRGFENDQFWQRLANIREEAVGKYEAEITADLKNPSRMRGRAHLSLFDVESDPSERQNLFDIKDPQILAEKLSGKLLEVYRENGNDLEAAAQSFFVNFYTKEIEKGYQKSKYPKKFWSTIIGMSEDFCNYKDLKQNKNIKSFIKMKSLYLLRSKHSFVQNL